MGVAVVVFLDMVGILEGFAPRRVPATLLSEVSEHADCVSSRSKSEASLPRRLLALLPARLPARLVGRLAAFLGSARPLLAPEETGEELLLVSPTSEVRLEWKVGRFSLLPAAGVTLAPLAGVAGDDGIEAQLWLLWLALELERVGEAAREDGLDLRPRERNGVMPCEAPSGRMNFSRSSRLVRPRALQGSFFTKNSSRAIQPPPTRTMTVLRRIRTSRSCWESPN